MFGGSPVNEARLRRISATIDHRGPDDHGTWCDTDAGIGLAHVRLSILDLSSAGHQPMVSASGRYVIVFNGEIYNHVLIRSRLEDERVAPKWRGHSDTEVLLAAFDAWGIRATVERCVGMFAIAVWDRHRRILTLGRDRIGEKPLYYGWWRGEFIFGSELKALRAHHGSGWEIDRDALAAFMRFSYIPAPKSIYRGIYKLPPGTLLTIGPSDPVPSEPVAYWSLLDVARRGASAPFTGSDAEALSALEMRLRDAVSIQQIADVPLGAFLSGGVDSTAIVALMQRQSNRPVHTFTIGFSDSDYNEATHAQAVARHLETWHTELYVTPDEAREAITRLPRIYDEPFGDSSQIPTFLVSALARRHVKVSLSGDAGDELFGGYNRYLWARRIIRFPRLLRTFAARLLSSVSPSRWDHTYEMCRPFLPASLHLRMPGDKAHKLASVLSASSVGVLYERLVSACPDPEVIVVGGHETTALADSWDDTADIGECEKRMMALDTLTYLPDDILCKVDRAAMGVSLETRVPFLDHRVVEFAWSLPLRMNIRNGQGKWILRQLVYKYVPRELIERPKMGFGVPIGAWLRGPLRDWAESLVDQSRIRQEGYLDAEAIRKKWLEHQSGARNWQYPLWNVLMFQAWMENEKQGGNEHPVFAGGQS